MAALIGYVSIGSLRYGGIETDAYTVVFFDLWKPEPVFHRYATETHGRDDDPTACGLPTWNETLRHTIGQVLPTFQAARIGRPCRKCWPEWSPPLEDA